jgi:hypothetical protein
MSKIIFSGGTGQQILPQGEDVAGNLASATQTLTNKTIDADNNTLSNLEVDNLKSGVLDTDISSVSTSDDTLASAKAIKTYVDSQAGVGAVAAVEAEATLDLTGQLTATNANVPATFTRVGDNENPTMILEKDVGTSGDMSKRSSMLYAVKNNTTTKYLGLTAWDDDATLGKTMRVRSLTDDATSGTDIAFFSGNSVDFQGDITVGGTGASLLQSTGHFEIDCSNDNLTITAGDIIATLDGGTY